MKCIYCGIETGFSGKVCTPCDQKKFKEFFSDPETEKMMKKEMEKRIPYTPPRDEYGRKNK